MSKLPFAPVIYVAQPQYKLFETILKTDLKRI